MGAKIIRPISALKECLDPVLHHHEKLDGSGYPHGLKGEEISIESRIVAVSDIFDALYTNRPYRTAMPLEKVLSIIKEDMENGKLDPIVVSHLLDMVSDGTVDRIYKD